MGRHRTFSGKNVHGPYRNIFADSAARLADAGPYLPEESVTGGSLNPAIALQLDTFDEYLLVDDSPITWFRKSGVPQAGTARFFVPAPDLNVNLGDHRVRSISGTGNHRFVFAIPADFISLITLCLIGRSTVTISADIDVTSDYGKDVEDYDAHSEARDGGTTPTALTANQIERFDISDVFSNLEAGDVCGFNWDHNSIGGTVYYWGVEVRYTK